MILAAGLGTRLRPLTYELPKPIVPVLGRPLCSYNMEFLSMSGVRSFVMNLHARPKLIQQRVAGWTGGKIRVDYTLEPEILGTGGGIGNAGRYLEGGTFVTANSDTVTRFRFADALAYHRDRKAVATLVLFPDPERRYTPVWIDETGRIAGIGSGAAGVRSGFYTGFQIVEPALLKEIPPGRASCIIRETYLRLVSQGAPLFGFLTSGTFREFGSPSDYLEGTLELLTESSPRKGEPASPPDGVTIVPPVYISSGAKIAAGARIGPEAVIEDGAVVKEGASVRRAILWPNAIAGAGDEISGAILTPNRRVDIS